MATLEQLTMNGAITLLTHLQYSNATENPVNAEALAAALCMMLNQLEADFPGTVASYGWIKNPLSSYPTLHSQ
jgi:hypothetical protein